MHPNASVFKIGELAQCAGLSVRALHHYDAIGLLCPSARTASGARRYGAQDLIRLHRIQALKQSGLSLADIQALLNDPHTDIRFFDITPDAFAWESHVSHDGGDHWRLAATLTAQRLP